MVFFLFTDRKMGNGGSAAIEVRDGVVNLEKRKIKDDSDLLQLLDEARGSTTSEINSWDLTQNSLSAFPSLDETKNVIRMFLSGNQIDRFPSDFPSRYSSMRILEIGGNRLEKLDGACLPESMTTLSLYNNRIEQIHFAKGQAPNLAELLLTGNRLSNL